MEAARWDQVRGGVPEAGGGGEGGAGEAAETADPAGNGEDPVLEESHLQREALVRGARAGSGFGLNGAHRREKMNPHQEPREAIPAGRDGRGGWDRLQRRIADAH